MGPQPFFALLHAPAGTCRCWAPSSPWCGSTLASTSHTTSSPSASSTGWGAAATAAAPLGVLALGWAAVTMIATMLAFSPSIASHVMCVRRVNIVAVPHLPRDGRVSALPPHRLVTDGFVNGWADPRLLTLSGLRRRGVTSAAINSFCREVGGCCGSRGVVGGPGSHQQPPSAQRLVGVIRGTGLSCVAVFGGPGSHQQPLSAERLVGGTGRMQLGMHPLWCGQPLAAAHYPPLCCLWPLPGGPCQPYHLAAMQAVSALPQGVTALPPGCHQHTQHLMINSCPSCRCCLFFGSLRRMPSEDEGRQHQLDRHTFLSHTSSPPPHHPARRHAERGQGTPAPAGPPHLPLTHTLPATPPPCQASHGARARCTSTSWTITSGRTWMLAARGGWGCCVRCGWSSPTCPSLTLRRWRARWVDG